jgi:hypothetical protein
MWTQKKKPKKSDQSKQARRKPSQVVLAPSSMSLRRTTVAFAEERKQHREWEREVKVRKKV